jgi:hypothetical protein
MRFNRPYIEDPEPGDENDKSYREEMYATFQYMGLKPEDLRQDKKWADEYRQWLIDHPESGK